MKNTSAAKTGNGIGTRNEKSLHNSIKQRYAEKGDQFEVKVDNYIIDIVRDNLLIEIQTRNFSAIRTKLRNLVKKYKVRLIYPVPVEKWIVKIDVENGKTLSRRKSPKKGRPDSVFEELLRIPELINDKNFELELMMLSEEEIRCADGKGSWRRQGISIIDRKLIDVNEIIQFRNKNDFIRFIPEDLDRFFTNSMMAESISVSKHYSRRITYCLKKMGLIREVGRKGRELLFERIL